MFSFDKPAKIAATSSPVLQASNDCDVLFIIGDLTNTSVALMYIEEKANAKIVNNIKEKLTDYSYKFVKIQGRYLLTDYEEYNESKKEIKRSFDLLDTDEYRDILINGHRPINQDYESSGYSIEKEETPIEEFHPTHSNYEYYTEPKQEAKEETQFVPFEEAKVVEVEPLPWEDDDTFDMVEDTEEEVVEEIYEEDYCYYTESGKFWCQLPRHKR